MLAYLPLQRSYTSRAYLSLHDKWKPKNVQLDEIMKIVFTLLGSFMTTIWQNETKKFSKTSKVIKSHKWTL